MKSQCNGVTKQADGYQSIGLQVSCSFSFGGDIGFSEIPNAVIAPYNLSVDNHLNNDPLKAIITRASCDLSLQVSEQFLRSVIEDILKSVDIFSPPGFAGVVCDELAKVERRELRRLRPLSSLTLISAVCRSRKGYNTNKLNLMFLASAATAQGKEAHLQFIKDVLLRVGLGEMMCAAPRSDKSFYLELAAKGGTIYVIDEVHSFFDCATSAKASSFQADMLKMILELNTTGFLLFPENIQSELKERLNSQIKLLSNKTELDQDETKQLEYLKSAVTLVKNGWRDPFVAFIGFSTPGNLNRIVKQEHIASGLLGRFIYLTSPGTSGVLTTDPFADAQRKPKEEIPAHLIARFKQISESDQEISLASDAKQILSLVLHYLELGSVRDHPTLGGLYRRGVERICQISSLLAMETAVISAEMACYATAMFFDHVKACEDALNGSSAKDDEIVFDKAHSIVLDILKFGAQKKGVVANQLVKRCAEIRKKRVTHKKYEYVVLNELVEASIILDREDAFELVD